LTLGAWMASCERGAAKQTLAGGSRVRQLRSRPTRGTWADDASQLLKQARPAHRRLRRLAAMAAAEARLVARPELAAVDRQTRGRQDRQCDETHAPRPHRSSVLAQRFTSTITTLAVWMALCKSLDENKDLPSTVNDVGRYFEPQSREYQPDHNVVRRKSGGTLYRCSFGRWRCRVVRSHARRH
jgi:hypothetical protein